MAQDGEAGTSCAVGVPVALVAACLGATGVALADAAVRGNALPTVLISELETLGLAGPVGVIAEADLQAMYGLVTVAGALDSLYGLARVAKS
ncbi:hypothetical protein [Thiocapsa bogorovii]|uniref:hypothetical protein n=1 Tax=Thiocapsa bogorovii TaxID=521689 RepID=UPI001E626500|nr:hypothetical protein [Thiocapsa bogorovii]UHD15085.1 hypothetical protein LT988_17600 [Thiocapsa bogorovii]